MNSSRYSKSQLKHLALMLCTTADEIEYVVQNVDSYYNYWTEKKQNKETKEYKTYKDGTVKVRTLMPPKYRLKKIQSKIKDVILADLIFPDNIYGGVKGKNNIVNAAAHKGNKYKFCTDLQDFYPTITNKAVYDALLKLPGINNVKAYWLTKLTTWKHQLPQGAPTSTHLSNLVFLKNDQRIIEYCTQNNLTYTRFVDDLTISASYDFRPLIPDIMSMITENGYKISHRKTTYNGVQNVTGIIVSNNNISAPKQILDKAKSESIGVGKAPYTNYVKNIEKVNKR